MEGLAGFRDLEFRGFRGIPFIEAMGLPNSQGSILGSPLQ